MQHNANFKKNIKVATISIQKGLQKFSNNIFIKSLVSGFVSAMPIILVSSIFILIYSIPEAISPDYLGAGKDNFFNHFKSFCLRTYQFSYGLLGMIVTGNIARSMMEELNLKLPYNIRVKSHVVLLAGMIIYLIMAAIPIVLSDSNQDGILDISQVGWFDGLKIAQLGAQGILPGIIIGLTTPWIFYWCYKYNITIRMPKSVPGVISQSFLSMIPLLISIIIWSLISYGFILGLKEPFIPWFFDKLGGFIPKPINIEEFNKLSEAEKQLKILETLNSFSNSYGIIVLYKFFETFSWFIGVHPEAIQGVFESIMSVNQQMNLTLQSVGHTGGFAFVNSLMGPTGGMGGTGATFVVPIICLLFCKSDQMKIAGKTSIIPTSFQVNEPILFGSPIVLNPYYLFPFIFVPMVNSVLAKVFVDNFGLTPTAIDIPWATPWFIRGPLSHNGQPILFLLLLICFVISFVVYLPFILMYDNSLVKQEIAKIGKENFIAINGFQYQLNKTFNFDSISQKEYYQELKKLKKENYSSDIFIEKKNELKNIKQVKAEENLINLFERIKEQKIKKENSRFQDSVQLINSKLSQLEQQMESKNELINQKIEYLDEFEKLTEKDYSSRKEKLKEKILNSPKTFEIKKDYKGIHNTNLFKIETNFLIRKLKIKISKTKDIEKKKEYKNEIIKLKDKYKNHLVNYKENIKENNLINDNKILLNHKNPYEIIEDKKEVTSTNNVNIFNFDKTKTYKVLVLCIGAGTSAMLANAIKEGAKNQKEINISANALAYDSYKEALKDVDLIITSPQLRSYLSSIEKDAAEYKVKVVPTRGKQYIDLTNSPNDAFKFAIENIAIKEK